MNRLRIGRSYWLDAFRHQTLRPGSLHGRHTADVAIVGGGITGCATALLFARAGARVVLVDARRIGRGSTAASTALLMQEPDVDFRDLAERYGTASARRIWTSSRAAVKTLRHRLAALGIPGLHTLPSLYYTRDEGAVPALRHEAAMRRRAGLPGRWLDARGVKRAGGFDAAGAILTPGNAQVDPYAACLGFAAGARDAGARLFERTRVLRIEATRQGAVVRVPGGRIDADWAVIATGYATPEFEPLAARFRMMNTYVVATERLTRAQRRRLGLGDVMLWDTERPYHYLRWTPDGRLLFGGRDTRQALARRRRHMLRTHAGLLLADLRELYPALDDVRAEYAWEGLFATTPDGLPYIGPHRRYPRQLFALGYGGNGMTFGFLAAQLLVRLVNGRPTPDDDLFAFNRRA